MKGSRIQLTRTKYVFCIPLCIVIVHNSLWQFGSSSASSFSTGAVFHIRTLVSTGMNLCQREGTIVTTRDFKQLTKSSSCKSLAIGMNMDRVDANLFFLCSLGAVWREWLNYAAAKCDQVHEMGVFTCVSDPIWLADQHLEQLLWLRVTKKS